MKEITKEVTEQLIALQSQIDELRAIHGISAKNETTFQADLNSVDDELVVVVADGLGGATCMRVEGNYDIDFQSKNSKVFISEHDAAVFANMVIDKGDWEEAEEAWEAGEREYEES